MTPLKSYHSKVTKKVSIPLSYDTDILVIIPLFDSIVFSGNQFLELSLTFRLNSKKSIDFYLNAY